MQAQNPPPQYEDLYSQSAQFNSQQSSFPSQALFLQALFSSKGDRSFLGLDVCGFGTYGWMKSGTASSYSLGATVMPLLYLLRTISSCL
jgi:hypothetical protein